MGYNEKYINCCKFMYINIRDFIDDKIRIYFIEIVVLFCDWWYFFEKIFFFKVKFVCMKGLLF